VTLVIVATVGGASSNSYTTLAAAETYMEGRLNGDLWDAASDDDKNRALVEATRELQVLPWAGLRTDETQALAWPRQFVLNPDSPTLWYYDDAVIPDRVSDACMELAFQFVNAGTTDLAALDSVTGIKRKKVDVLETEYFGPGGARPTGLRRYPRVWDRISALLESRPAGVEVVRG
jgi:Putative DnaT-like ssDNA binding protein